MEDANPAKKKWLDGLKAAEEEFQRLHPEEYQEYERITSAADEASEAIDASRKEMIELRVKSEMPQEYETLQQLSGSEREAYLESLGQQIQRQVSPQLIKSVVDEAVRVLCPVMTGDFAKEMMKLSSTGGISNLDHALEKYKMAIKEVPSASDKEISMKAMEGYKTLIEGPYRRLSAIICYAMIKAEKHHKYLEDKKSHAMPQSLAEVAKTDIGGMMAFMGAENHSVFTDKVNKTLRNAAGHENYKVEKDGSITYWDNTHPPQTISINELNDEIDSLVDLLYAMDTGLKVAVGVWSQHILKNFDTDDVAKR